MNRKIFVPLLVIAYLFTFISISHSIGVKSNLSPEIVSQDSPTADINKSLTGNIAGLRGTLKAIINYVLVDNKPIEYLDYYMKNLSDLDEGTILYSSVFIEGDLVAEEEASIGAYLDRTGAGDHYFESGSLVVPVKVSEGAGVVFLEVMPKADGTYTSKFFVPPAVKWNRQMSELYDIWKNMDKVSVSNGPAHVDELEIVASTGGEKIYDWVKGDGLNVLAGVPQGSVLQDSFKRFNSDLRKKEQDALKLHLNDPKTFHITVSVIKDNTVGISGDPAVAEEKQEIVNKVHEALDGAKPAKVRFYYKDITMHKSGEIIALGFVDDNNLYDIRGKIHSIFPETHMKDIVHITLGRFFDDRNIDKAKEYIEEVRKKVDKNGQPALLGEFTINELFFWDQSADGNDRYGSTYPVVPLEKGGYQFHEDVTGSFDGIGDRRGKEEIILEDETDDSILSFLDEVIDKARINAEENNRLGVYAILVDDDSTVLAEKGQNETALKTTAKRWDHAEINLLSAYEDKYDGLPTGKIAVVSLEPCDQCARALVNRGIKKVVIGTLDPDNRVSASGVKYLIRNGVEVKIAPAGLQRKALELYYERRKAMSDMDDLARNIDNAIAFNNTGIVVPLDNNLDFLLKEAIRYLTVQDERTHSNRGDIYGFNSVIRDIVAKIVTDKEEEGKPQVIAINANAFDDRLELEKYDIERNIDNYVPWMMQTVTRYRARYTVIAGTESNAKKVYRRIVDEKYEDTENIYYLDISERSGVVRLVLAKDIFGHRSASPGYFNNDRPVVCERVNTLVKYMAMREEPVRGIDLLLVLGSKDERGAIEAAEYYKKNKHKIKYVMCSGKGNGEIPEGDRFTQIMIEHGVPVEVFLDAEVESGFMSQNLEFSSKKVEHLIASGDIKSVMIMQQPIYNRQAKRAYNKNFIVKIDGPNYVYAPYLPNINEKSHASEVVALIKDLENASNTLKVNGDKGWIDKTVFPDHITAILEELGKKKENIETNDVLATTSVLAEKVEDEFVIAIEADWVPGYEEGKLQFDAMNPLMGLISKIDAILAFKGIKNVRIEIKKRSESLDTWKKRVFGDDHKEKDLSNILVLSSIETINDIEIYDIIRLDKEKRPFLAAINPEEILKSYKKHGENDKNQMFIDIMQYLSISLDTMLTGRAPNLEIVTFHDKQMRKLVLLPNPTLQDYGQISDANNIRTKFLKAA